MLGQLFENIIRSLAGLGGARTARNSRSAVLHEAAKLVDSGALPEARTLLQEWIETRPNDAVALHQFAQVLLKQNQSAEAIDYLERAITAEPNAAQLYLTYGNARRARGELEAASGLYARALALQEDCVEASVNLGIISCERGEIEEGAALLKKAAQMSPNLFQAHHNLGEALRALGMHEDAATSYRQALQSDPKAVETYSGLGASLRALGRDSLALMAYRKAAQLSPESPDAHYCTANLLYELGQFREAKAHLERVLNLRPDFPEALNGMGAVLLRMDDPEGALRWLREALQLRAAFAEAQNNLGMALHKLGMLEEAQAAFRKALEVKPDFLEAHSNLIFAMDYDLRLAIDEQFAERRRWQELHVDPSIAARSQHDNNAEAGRRIRVGYVSADFRHHAAASAFGPMLLHYDRTSFEVLCYSNSLLDDDVTRQFRGSVDGWRNIVQTADADAERLIRADRIDILVDLSGHSAGNRLLLFSRRPAPVQVSAWGHFAGTGLDAMDYIFADAITTPEEERRYFIEKVVYLPCLLTHMPQVELPPVTPLPASTQGFVTFGYFNNYAKLSDEALELWAELLSSIPSSRMLFKSGQFDHPKPRQRVLETFHAAGIVSDRLTFLGATPLYEHLKSLCSVDIALDPFPRVGGVSTIEALRMGTPVVTLRGQTHASRVSASILTVVGLNEWIGESARQYLDIARRQAQDLALLERLRSSLRDRVTDSPIGNPGQYVTAVEQAYRDMWRRWCACRRGHALPSSDPNQH